MCPQHDLIHQITIQLDGRGQPLGATVIRHWSSDHELVHPLGVGPFDTPQEVYESCLRSLDIQLTLW